MIVQLDNVFMPKHESSLARLEFQQYKQHPDEPALAYLANKRMLYNKGWPTNQDLTYLRTKMMEDLCNIAVKRDLYMEVFSTCEQMQERILSVIAGQR